MIDSLKSDFHYAFYDRNDKCKRTCEILWCIHKKRPIKSLEDELKTQENLHTIIDGTARMLKESGINHGSIDPFNILFVQGVWNFAGSHHGRQE